MDASESVVVKGDGGVGGCADRGGNCGGRSDDDVGVGIASRRILSADGGDASSMEEGGMEEKRSQRRLQAIGYDDIDAGCVSASSSPPPEHTRVVLPFASRASSTTTPFLPVVGAVSQKKSS